MSIIKRIKNKGDGSIFLFLALFFCLLLPAVLLAAPIAINNESQYTNSTTVTLNLSLQDIPNANNISQMSFSNNNAIWSEPEPFTLTKSWNLFPQGDVNENGKVDIGDALSIAQYRVGKRQLTPSQLSLADANQNNKVDIGDALFIAQYLVGKRSNLPVNQAQRTVYVKFKYLSGSWSDIYSGSIILDTKGPSLEIISPQEGQMIKE